MSHKLISAILFTFALLSTPLSAQTALPVGNAPPVASNKQDTLTPEQAKRALDTLQDDQKRAQMIDTLRAIANASTAAQSRARPGKTIRDPAHRR